MFGSIWLSPLYGDSSLFLNKSIPSVKDFSIPGYITFFTKQGNLNSDEINDYVVVYAVENSKPEKYGNGKRILVAFVSNQLREYTIIAYNENIIYPFGHDENFPESLVDIVIDDGYLSIDQYGGFAERWGRRITFKYDALSKSLLFVRDTTTYFKADQIDTITREKTISSDRSTVKTIQDYNIDTIR
jgi:hypothetical protein